MLTLYIALTLGTLGKVLLGVAVVRVHMHMAREHKIDGDVIASIKRERFGSLAAILLIIIGYAMEMWFYSGVVIR